MRRASLYLIAAALVTVLAASPAQADEPVREEKYEPEAHPPTGTGSRMFWAGAITTGVWYGGALSFSYLWPSAPGADDLRIPVAGPWMALGDTGCAKNDPNCGLFGVILRALLTTIDAVGQTGGVLIMVESLFLQTDEPGPRRERKLPPAKDEARITPTPIVTDSGAVGLGISGRF